MRLSQESSDAFFKSAANTNYNFICGYTTSYIAEKLVGYNVAFEELISAIKGDPSNGATVHEIVTAFDNLHIRHRLLKFDGNYDFGSDTSALLFFSGNTSQVGHALVVRKIKNSFQVVDAPSAPYFASKLPSADLVMYVFPSSAPFWETWTSYEVGSCAFLFGATFLIVLFMWLKTMLRGNDK